MDVHESKPYCPSSTSASILDGARDVRIDGAKFTNVAGNSESTVDSSSNVVVFIKLESGICFRSVLVLLIIVFLILAIMKIG